MHPLVQKAQRAAGRIRDAASAATPEERMAHLESAHNIVLGLKLRLIIGDLQRITGLMERRLIPGDAREYLRIASIISTLRDPAQNFGMASFGLGPSLIKFARAAGEQDAETLKQTLQSVAAQLDAA